MVTGLGTKPPKLKSVQDVDFDGGLKCVLFSVLPITWLKCIGFMNFGDFQAENSDINMSR